MDFKETLSCIAPKGPVWVYLSGPNAFITTGEKACQEMGLDYYGARWEI